MSRIMLTRREASALDFKISLSKSQWPIMLAILPAISCATMQAGSCRLLGFILIGFTLVEF